MTSKNQTAFPGTALRKLFIPYLGMLVILLLWPFDLFKENPTHWLSKENGIAFTGNGMVATLTPIPEFCRKMKAGQGLTIEVWLSPANTTQSGPARIISYSYDTVLRNFTLGQQGKDLVSRLRTSKTNLNGMNPDVTVENVFHATVPIHIVVTYDFIYQDIFVDGIKKIHSNTPGGDFENWDPNYYLAFGNEITWDRPWQGKILKAYMYNRPLKETEIMENYQEGWESNNTTAKTVRGKTGLIAGFLFGEGHGNSINNIVPDESPKKLYVPRFLYNIVKPVVYLQLPADAISHRSLLIDTILNVFGFIPFGFLLHGRLSNRFGQTWRISALVLVLGALVSFSAESLQYYSISRHSSVLDVYTNTLGTGIGIIIYRFTN